MFLSNILFRIPPLIPLGKINIASMVFNGSMGALQALGPGSNPGGCSKEDKMADKEEYSVESLRKIIDTQIKLERGLREMLSNQKHSIIDIWARLNVALGLWHSFEEDPATVPGGMEAVNKKLKEIYSDLEKLIF